jgi:hypothetical protein
MIHSDREDWRYSASSLVRPVDIVLIVMLLFIFAYNQFYTYVLFEWIAAAVYFAWSTRFFLGFVAICKKSEARFSSTAERSMICHAQLLLKRSLLFFCCLLR